MSKINMTDKIIYTFVRMETAQVFNFSKRECLIDFLKQNNFSFSKEDEKEDGDLGWNDFMNGKIDIEIGKNICYEIDTAQPIVFKTILH